MNNLYLKSKTFLVVYLLFSMTVFSQKAPVFKITEFRHDFGVIQEKDGEVKYTFAIENPGGDTLRVVKMKPSAANINATFIPYKIAPSGKGELILTYDPTNDKGKVERLVSVRTNDPQNPIRQFGIKAEVIPSVKTLADQYPVKMGNLKLKARHLVMDKLLSTASRTDSFKVYNAWNKTMTLTVKNPVDHASLKLIPTELKPGQEGLIILTFDAAKSGNYGLDLEYFRIGTNDTLEPEKLLSLGFNIIEDFSYLKANPELRAKAHFEINTHNFGTVKAGNTVDFTYPVENYGKGDLIIRKTKASCGCTVPKLEKTVIKPGEKGSIRVFFNTSGMEGGESKSVTVVCNDPDNPVTMLTFTANVEK